MSLVRDPAAHARDHIQLGYTVLPQSESSLPALLMRHWIKVCDESHACMTAVTDAALPRRLVSTNYEVEGGVRLCSTAELGPQVRYTALTYVWGMPIEGLRGLERRTILANLEELQRGMDYSLLNKTCRDAIRVTRQLGIEYIWVDTLCIVQDSPEEMQEVMETGKIFHNAYCVLVASSALDVTEGFLGRPRRSRLVVPLRRPDDGVALSICELVDDFHKDVDASPHSSRGWPFQERVLARRTIYFTSTQMYWQCGEGIRCETLTRLRK